MKSPWIPLLVAFVFVAGCGGKRDESASSTTPADGHSHEEPEALEDTIAKAKQLNLPTTIEEFTASRPNRADEAGPIYVKLEPLTKSEHTNVLERYIEGKASDAEADKALAGLTNYFPTMDEATSKQSFAPKRDFSLGMQVDYKEYDPMRKVCVVYSARGLREARKGNIDAAIANYSKAAATIKHAASEDLAMSEYLTTVCLDEWARAATTAAVEKSEIRPRLVELIKTIPLIDAKSAVGTDFALIKATIERIRKGETTYSKIAGYDEPILVNGKNMDDMLSKDLDLAEKYALAFVVRAYEKWEDRKAILDMLHAAEHSSQNESEETTALHAFEALAMSFTAPLKNGEALTKAQLECLRIAIAAADIKKSTGKAPTLAEAAKAAGVGEIDPFSGKPYQLKADDKGITVWSVGLDQEDNGGKPYVPGEYKGTDVSVTL